VIMEASSVEGLKNAAKIHTGVAPVRYDAWRGSGINCYFIQLGSQHLEGRLGKVAH